MNKVIDFPKAEDNGPHATGYAVCWSCGCRWQAVWPLSITENHLVCECGKPTWIPPTSDEEAIRRAAERFESVGHEMRVIRDKLTGGYAKQVDAWADAHFAFAKMLQGYVVGVRQHPEKS